MSPQLSCGDTCQIWLWYSIGIHRFENSEKNGKITKLRKLTSYTPPRIQDVIKLKYFPRYWSPVNSPHKGQWRRALMSCLICPWTNDSANNRDTGDLRRRRIHYDVTVMLTGNTFKQPSQRGNLPTMPFPANILAPIMCPERLVHRMQPEQRLNGVRITPVMCHEHIVLGAFTV